MDMLKKLPREAQVVLGCTVLYVIISFLDWQQVSFASLSAGINEWHGVGVIAALLAIALLVWEGARLAGVRVALGPITPELGSLGLALLLLLFTVITFLSHNEARHWPAWIGLLLSVAITVAAFGRARAEGVDVRDFGAIASGVGGQAKTDNGGESTPAAEPPADDRPTAPSQPET